MPGFTAYHGVDAVTHQRRVDELAPAGFRPVALNVSGIRAMPAMRPRPGPARTRSGSHLATGGRPRRAPDLPETGPWRAHTRVPHRCLTANTVTRRRRSSPRSIIRAQQGHYRVTDQHPVHRRPRAASATPLRHLKPDPAGIRGLAHASRCAFGQVVTRSGSSNGLLNFPHQIIELFSERGVRPTGVAGGAPGPTVRRADEDRLRSGQRAVVPDSADAVDGPTPRVTWRGRRARLNGGRRCHCGTRFRLQHLRRRNTVDCEQEAQHVGWCCGPAAM